MEFSVTKHEIEIDGNPMRRFSCGLVAFSATELAYERGTCTDEILISLVEERCRLVLELPEDDKRELICYDETMRPKSYPASVVKESIRQANKMHNVKLTDSPQAASPAEPKA